MISTYGINITENASTIHSSKRYDSANGSVLFERGGNNRIIGEKDIRQSQSRKDKYKCDNPMTGMDQPKLHVVTILL